MAEMLASMDTDYVVYDPQPKHLNAIFEQVRHAQEIFATDFRYSSPDVALLAGLQFVNRINEYLKEFSKKDKVWGEAATLSGAGVICSHMTANYFTGDMTTGPSVPSDEEGVFDSQTANVVGKFRGLGCLVHRRDDDRSGRGAIDSQDLESKDLYCVRLYYRVATGVSEHAFGSNEMYTLGEVGLANLIFEEDAEREAAREALTQLLSNNSLEIAELVNELNQALTSPKHTAKQIRTIAKVVQKLHACDALRTADSEAILDLITTYIPPQAAYKIKAKDVLEYEAAAGRVERSLVQRAGGAPLEFEQYISDIILAPGYDPGRSSDDPLILKATGTVPYFVIESEKLVFHASMDRVVGFGDVT